MAAAYGGKPQLQPHGELVAQTMPYTQTAGSGYLTPQSGAPAIAFSIRCFGQADTADRPGRQHAADDLQ